MWKFRNYLTGDFNFCVSQDSIIEAESLGQILICYRERYTVVGLCKVAVFESNSRISSSQDRSLDREDGYGLKESKIKREPTSTSGRMV